MNQEFFTLLGGFSDSGRRPECARAIAHALGAEDLLLFAKDADVNFLLPGLGISTELPEKEQWRNFVNECARGKYHTHTLPSPKANQIFPVTGIKANDGSTLVLLGGTPDLNRVTEVLPTVPLLVADLRGEMDAENFKLKSELQRVRSELRLKSQALENSLNGFDIVNSEGLLVYANRAYLRMWGYDSLDEIIGMPAAAHCVDPSTPLTIIHALKTKGECSIDFLARRKDGSTFDVHMWAHIDHDSEGREFYPTTSIDITQRKRTEAALLHQSEITSAITENATSCLFMLDERGFPTFLNPAAMKTTGYHDLDEIRDRPLHHSIHWKRPDGGRYPIEECPVDSGSSRRTSVQNQEEVFCRKDGSLFPVSYTVTPLQRNGGVVGSVLEFRDISNQKSTEAMLMSAIQERDRWVNTLALINQVGQRLTSELDPAKVAQQVIDAATRHSNARFGLFFHRKSGSDPETSLQFSVSGMDPARVTGLRILRDRDLFRSMFNDKLPHLSNDIRIDPKFEDIRTNLCVSDGCETIVSYLAIPVVARSGEVSGGLVFGHEKTGVFDEQSMKTVEGLASQAAIAMDNAHLYQSAQESVRARDQFLSIASHELRTPLTSLKLQAQLRTRQLERGELKTFTGDRLKSMNAADLRQIDRLTRLIDDMLDISRINTGKLSIHIERFDLLELTQDVIERHSMQFRAGGSRIILHPGEEVTGQWDRLRIEQVITNLLSNAVRYGAGKPVEVHVWKEVDRAILTVRDQGIGIAREHHERIFQRFERAISASEISGLGLGLFIVRQIVDMHHGRVSVDSSPGQGAAFRVELPLRRSD